jgi:hypothetical protein
MKNSQHISQARAFANERFSGIDGFDNFSDAYQFNDDLNAAGVNMHQYNAKTSMPYEFTVANSNTVATSVSLFNSYVNRTASNQGAPAGVVIASTLSNVTYAGLLAQSEHKNFECGMIYIEVTAGSNSGVTAAINLTQLDATNESTTKTLLPKINPMQQQANVLEFYNTFKINGYTNLVITIPASTTIKYSFYASATIDPGRKLGNMSEIKDYRGPQISKPQQVVISPAAAAALRG